MPERGKLKIRSSAAREGSALSLGKPSKKGASHQPQKSPSAVATVTRKRPCERIACTTGFIEGLHHRACGVFDPR